MNFKVFISQIFAKIDPKYERLNKIRQCSTGQIQIWDHFYCQKNLLYFNNFYIQSFSLMTNVSMEQMEMEQTRHFSTGHIQIWQLFFVVKERNVFSHIRLKKPRKESSLNWSLNDKTHKVKSIIGIAKLRVQAILFVQWEMV